MPRKTAKSTTDGPAGDAPPRPAEVAASAPPVSAPLVAATPGAEKPPEPVPLAVPLEEQITALPPLTYPGSTNEEFDRWAADKRRSRLRLEIIGGALLVIAGIAVTVVSGRPAFAAVALFGVAGLLAYEFLVSSFE